jgi:HEAT repeat protein
MDQRQWQSLIEALRDVDNIDSAVAAAAQMQARASTEDVPRLVDLLADESFFVREAAAWPLSDLGRVDLLPQLLAAYNRGLAEGHDNDGFSAALIDLVQSKPAESQAQLSSLTSSADPELRKSAAWLLEFVQEAHDA